MGSISSRRDLLKGILLSGAGSFLAGCRLFTRRPVPTNPAAPSPLSPLLTMDVHCHIFNGSDLEVKDFFHKVVWKEKGVLDVVSSAVGAILEELVWCGAPDGDDETSMLHPLERNPVEGRVALIKRHHDERYRAARDALLRTKALSSVRRGPTQKLAGPRSATRNATRDNVLAEMRGRLQPKKRDGYTELRDRHYEAIRAAARRPENFSPANARSQSSAAGALDYLLENFQYRFGAMQDYLATYPQTMGRKV